MADEDTEVARLLEETAKYFRQAEAKLKLVEKAYEEGPFIPAINELRYAGRHLVESLASSSDKERIEEAQKARRHCQRALYDVHEAQVIALLERFNTFERKFSGMYLLDVIPDYEKLLALIDQIHGLLAEASESDAPTKEASYERLGALAEDLRSQIARLQRIEPQLDVKARESQTESQRAVESHRVSIRRYRVTVAALVLGVFGFAYDSGCRGDLVPEEHSKDESPTDPTEQSPPKVN